MHFLSFVRNNFQFKSVIYILEFLVEGRKLKVLYIYTKYEYIYIYINI